MFFASTINYVDRQTISVLAPHLGKIQNWSQSDYAWIVFAFQLAYAIMLLISGPLIDWLGTRVGYALALIWWSIAAMAHALASSAFSFGIARFFLGIGEGGNFPAAIKAVAEWFPKKERALATGIFNAGTNIGAMVAPPLVVWLTLKWSWRFAFIFTGSLGFIWLIFWLMTYRLPHQHPTITEEELRHIQSDSGEETARSEPKISWAKILGYRQAWGFILAKTMTDPIWWFYVYWLPKYLNEARGFSLQKIAAFAWIPYLVADVGSVGGGWLSSFWIKRGWPINRARKTTMAILAFLMPCGIVAVFAPSAAVALALISIAMAAHQGWSANVFTLSSDMFPTKDVASVVGLGGAGGAVGGLIIAPVTGYILKWFNTYVPIFIIAGVMHPLALGVIYLLVRRIEPVSSVAAPGASR